MFIVDAHLDLAYNALEYGRDLRLTVRELRQAEAGRKVGDGLATVTFPSLVAAGVGLVFATIFVGPYRPQRPDNKLVYRDAEEAYRVGMTELDYYYRIADELDYVRIVGNQAELDEVTASRQPGNRPLLGIVPLMEGADPIRRPEEVEEWYERGLRLVGLAWDDTRYAYSALRDEGGITREGYQLMEVMADLGMILDLTHMSEKATFEALDRYPGPVVASHVNARALVPMRRQFSDEQIRRLAEREGVIGIVLCNGFLKAGCGPGDPKHAVTLEHVVAHIDHICQLLGDAAHVGLGSDFDGGFGAERIPAELDNVLDMPLIGAAMHARGYGEDDIANIMGGNWVALLQRAWS